MSIQPVSDNTDPRKPVTEKINSKPSSREVSDYHTNSDVDSRPQAQHHTLGSKNGQAAPGDHTHDGGTSRQDVIPLTGFSLTGTRGSATAITSIIQALVQLGATNNTTP